MLLPPKAGDFDPWNPKPFLLKLAKRRLEREKREENKSNESENPENLKK